MVLKNFQLFHLSQVRAKHHPTSTFLFKILNIYQLLLLFCFFTNTNSRFLKINYRYHQICHHLPWWNIPSSEQHCLLSLSYFLLPFYNKLCLYVLCLGNKNTFYRWKGMTLLRDFRHADQDWCFSFNIHIVTVNHSC